MAYRQVNSRAIQDGTVLNADLDPTLVIPVSQGGTGASTLTGLVKGNGTGAFTTAVSGTDVKTINGSTLLGSGNLTLNTPLAWQVITTNTNVVAGGAYAVNTTSGAITLTLPASPNANDVISIMDYAGTFATNNLTVARNGNNIMGLAEDMTVSANNASFNLTYINATQGWRVS